MSVDSLIFLYTYLSSIIKTTSTVPRTIQFISYVLEIRKVFHSCLIYFYLKIHEKQLFL